MLEAVEQGDCNAALRKLLSEVQGVAKQFKTLIDGYLVFMMTTYFVNNEGKLDGVTVSITDIPRRDQLQIPFFVDDIPKG